MSIFSSVALAQMLRKLNFDEPRFICPQRGSVKDELLALLFQVFGVP